MSSSLPPPTPNRKSAQQQQRSFASATAAFATFVVAGLGFILVSDSRAGAVGRTAAVPADQSTPRGLVVPSPSVIPDPIDGVCNNALPYARMFDSRQDEVNNYQKYLENNLFRGTRTPDRPPPELRTLPDGSTFVIWGGNDGEVFVIPKKGSKWNLDPMASAWGPDGKDVLLNPNPRGRTNWLPHEPYMDFVKEEIVVHGDHAAWFGFQPKNYGHTLHENLPMVAYMRANLPPHTKFLLPDTKMMRKLVGFIDPSFALNRVVWLDAWKTVRVEGGTLTVSVMPDAPVGPLGSGAYNHLLVPYLRRWIAEAHPPANVPRNDDERTVVFYVRKGNANFRILEDAHREDIIAMVRRLMAEYGIKGELVFFTGHGPDGELLSFEEQMAIYRRAKYIVGPHGSGLANVIWTDPYPSSCEDRVKMLEFIPARDSAKVQHLYNGYYWVLGGLPVDWNQITYAGNSTGRTTYVNLPDLEDGLRYLFGGENKAAAAAGSAPAVV